MKTEYLAKFDAAGYRETAVVSGVHYSTDEERQKYIDDGYISISDEDYQHYIGNRGMGDNGTGYMRDPKTGKPVSAPPYIPTQEEQANQLASFYTARVQELNSDIILAMAEGDTDAVEELKGDKETALKEYKKALEVLRHE